MQQLTFFTNEWYDNLTPKFNETFELAERVDTNLQQYASIDKGREPSDTLDTWSSAELRVRNSLMRLRQSMSENERLIAAISDNIEMTRDTVDYIYDSLKSSRRTLTKGEVNLAVSLNVLSSTQRNRMIIAIIMIILAVIFCFLVVKILI